MSKNLLFLLLLLFYFSSPGQTINDTINKYNSKKQKNGYWIFYFDSKFKKCIKDSAKYYGFEYFDNGKVVAGAIGRTYAKDSMVFIPNLSPTSQRVPLLLNGELRTYSYHNKKLYVSLFESYLNGKVSVFKQYYLSSRDTSVEADILYFDSLYQNKPNSFLFYKTDNNILLYRQYFGKGKQLSDREYFVKAKEFKHQYRPIIGYFGSMNKPSDKSLKAKDFLELGFSKKYIRGVTIDTTKRTYHDNLIAFQALNFSLLGSNTRGNGCLGQKLSYSYCVAFLKAEAGIMNFTDFKQYDLRLMLGIGFEIPCRFTYMIQFSRPISGTQFKDINMLTFTIAID